METKIEMSHRLCDEPSAISTISSESLSIVSPTCTSSSPASSSSSSSTCRICYSSTSCTWHSKLLTKLGFLGDFVRKKHLISPCTQCKGSVGAVHDKCLEKWLAVSKSDKCDVCKSKLIVSKYPKGFKDWIRESDRNVKCYIVTDLLSFLFLTPITGLSIYLCIRGLMNHASSFYDVSCLILLILLVLISYLAWLITCIYQHYKCATLWCNSNFTLKTRASTKSSLDLPRYTLTSESSSVLPAREVNLHSNCNCEVEMCNPRPIIESSPSLANLGSSSGPSDAATVVHLV